MISVLIVEDDAFIRDITTIKFSEHAYDTVACATAIEALTAIANRTFDVLLLDIDLPDMPGLDLLSEMRMHKNGDNIKCIVFTNNDDDTVKKLAKELGVVGVYSKSSTLYPELFKLIDSVAATK